MSAKLKYTIVILATLSLAIGTELLFAFDGNPDTPTITQLVIEHINPEIVMFVVGGIAVWLVAHFGWRTWKKKHPG